jgi:hypothetical protein
VSALERNAAHLQVQHEAVALLLREVVAEHHST